MDNLNKYELDKKVKEGEKEFIDSIRKSEEKEREEKNKIEIEKKKNYTIQICTCFIIVLGFIALLKILR